MAILIWTTAAFLLLVVVGYGLQQSPRMSCVVFLLGVVVLLIAIGLVYYFLPVFIPVAWGGLTGFVIGTIIGIFI